jgi:hypothetical protein
MYMSTSTEDKLLAPEDVFPRAPEYNPYNYTELQKKKRDLALEAMMRDFPKLPQLWCEWIYDFVTNNPEAKVEDIINNNRWKVPTERNNLGGEVTCGEILTPEEYREQYGYSGYEKWLLENKEDEAD